MAAARFLPKRYTSQTLVLVQQPAVPGDYVKPVVSEDTTERLASMQQEILSRSRLEPIIQQFGLYREDLNRTPMEDLVDRLQKDGYGHPFGTYGRDESSRVARIYNQRGFQ